MSCHGPYRSRNEIRGRKVRRPPGPSGPAAGPPVRFLAGRPGAPVKWLRPRRGTGRGGWPRRRRLRQGRETDHPLRCRWRADARRYSRSRRARRALRPGTARWPERAWEAERLEPDRAPSARDSGCCGDESRESRRCGAGLLHLPWKRALVLQRLLREREHRDREDESHGKCERHSHHDVRSARQRSGGAHGTPGLRPSQTASSGQRRSRCCCIVWGRDLARLPMAVRCTPHFSAALPGGGSPAGQRGFCRSAPPFRRRPLRSRSAARLSSAPARPARPCPDRR